MACDTLSLNNQLHFCRELGFGPSPEAALEDVDILKTSFYKLSYHTGTCGFARSCSVEDIGFVFWVFIDPEVNRLKVFMHRTRYFLVDGLPLIMNKNINDDEIRIT